MWISYRFKPISKQNNNNQIPPENNFKCQNPTKKNLNRKKKTESNSSKQIFQKIGQRLYFLMKKN